MNIIVSTHDSLYPLQGGGALRTLKAAQDFKDKGHDVVIIAPAENKSEIDGIKIHWLHPPRKQRSQILSSFKFNVRLLRKFLCFAKETDVFFIHNTISAASMPFLKKFFKFKFALDITDIHAEYLPIGKRDIFERILTPYLIAYEYRIIRSADSVIAATEAMKSLLIKKGIDRDRIKVVYDGVDNKSFQAEKEPGSEKSIIHLGAIDRQHGLDLLIRAAALVVKNNPGAKFLFVGGGRELSNIKKLAGGLKVQESCIFTGSLPYEQAKIYLNESGIGVIPRRGYLANRIITTLKLYEYWASGTAVVSSRLEGITEIAQDYEDILFFDPGSAEDLAEKIDLLIKDNALRLKLTENGLQKAANFNWSKSAPKITEHALNAG